MASAVGVVEIVAAGVVATAAVFDIGVDTGVGVVTIVAVGVVEIVTVGIVATAAVIDIGVDTGIDVVTIVAVGVIAFVDVGVVAFVGGGASLRGCGTAFPIALAAARAADVV